MVSRKALFGQKKRLFWADYANSTHHFFFFAKKESILAFIE
jgi:hypothetical protein